ncbi:MAG: hypothetical protein ACI9KS_001905 [Sulfitobacter sp.]|jgi:hypothetical protein
MSQRFGGKHSPDGASEVPRADAPALMAGVKASKVGARVNFLFLAPLPVALFAFGKPPVSMAIALAGFGLLMMAAWLLREGLKAEEAYEARKVARRPAIPRKILASVATGLGLGLAGFAADPGLIAPAVYAVLGSVLHFVSFGPDPLKDKGMEGIDQFQTNRVAEAVDKAEAHLAAMTDAIARAGDREVERKVEQFQQDARAMFRKVEDDPRDLSGARKYMSVYLMGARDATVKFADYFGRSRDVQARADYLALLADLGGQFRSKTDVMLLDDRTDLDVEIEVLRDRLAREGVKARS